MPGNLYPTVDGPAAGTVVMMTVGADGIARPSASATPATDTNRVAVSTPDLLPFSGSMSAAGVIVTIDTTGYSSVVAQITSAGVGCTVIYEVSNDGTTWLGTYGITPSGSLAGTASTTASTGMLIFPVTGRMMRARVSTYGSGTITLSGFARDETIAQLDPQSTSRTVVTQAGPAALGSLPPSITRILSLATTNPTIVKATAASILGYDLFNNGAAWAYVKIYNVASGLVVGTTAVVDIIGIPPGGRAGYEPAFGLMNLSTGFALAITGGAADADITAVAAAQVGGHILYR